MRHSLAPSTALCAALLWLGPGCAKDNAPDSGHSEPTAGTGTGTGTGGAGTGTGAATGSGTGTGTGTGAGTGTGTTGISTTCNVAIVDPDTVNCTAEYWTAGPGAAASHSYDTVYDGCGRIARTDYLASGVVTIEQRYHYDLAGRLTSIALDGDGVTPPDGLPDREIAVVYDAADRVVQMETWLGGVYSCASHYTHLDADAFHEEIDDDCNNTLTVYTRQLDGDVDLTEVDQGRDGTVDATTVWTYDASDTLESLLTVSAYSTIRVWHTYANDLLTRFDMDIDDDGTIEVANTYAYDGLDRLIESTTASSGAPPTVTTGTWTCLP